MSWRARQDYPTSEPLTGFTGLDLFGEGLELLGSVLAELPSLGEEHVGSSVSQQVLELDVWRIDRHVRLKVIRDWSGPRRMVFLGCRRCFPGRY